jgi:hypothetical protein
VPALRPVVVLGAAAYTALDLGVAVAAARGQNVAAALWLVVVFPLLHVAYGTGFLRGVVDFLIRRKHGTPGVRAIAPSR